MLKPAARISLPADWQGTAEELASAASAFLAECGFDEKFFCTERLVRYYLARGVLTAPDRDPIDRRKALFGNLQFRQLVLTRLLAERGWDLERVLGQLVGYKGPKSVHELNDLLNQLAEPSQAEQMLFRSRRESGPSSKESIVYQSRSEPSLAEEEMESSAPKWSKRSHAERSPLPRQIIQAAKEDVTLRKLAIIAEKALADANLQEDEVKALRELVEMARLAFRNPSKKERWTRVKLAPWCEVNLRISGDIQLDADIKRHMVNEFKRILEDHNSRLS